jgi:hypothetical protein
VDCSFFTVAFAKGQCLCGENRMVRDIGGAEVREIVRRYH